MERSSGKITSKSQFSPKATPTKTVWYTLKTSPERLSTAELYWDIGIEVWEKIHLYL